MMDKKSNGYAFAEALAAGNLTKDQLFEHLHKAIGGKCSLKELRLPTNSAVASLESCKARCQIKAFEPRIVNTYRQLNQVSKIERKKELLDKLNIMVCKPRDYAVMALDCYFKMDRKHTLESFCSDYNLYLEKNGKIKAAPAKEEQKANDNGFPPLMNEFRSSLETLRA